MKHFPILQGKAHVVELPEGAYSIRLSKDAPLFRLDYRIDVLTTKRISRPICVWLPAGNWQIVGRLSEVTESEAAGMVDSDDQYGVTMYRNYKTTGMPYFDEQITAIQSLESAIVAGGYAFQSAPKPENKDFYWGYLKDLAKWEAAQSRVLCRERCLILKKI
jgi:hypothetical protein